MRQWNYDPHDQTVLVTQRDEDGTASPFVLTIEDARNMERFFALPKEVTGMPTLVTDANHREVKLQVGNVTIIVEREHWKWFQEKVADTNFPTTEIPSEVEVQLTITANHTITIDTEELIGGEVEYTEEGWEGDIDSLSDAITDAVNDYDFHDELKTAVDDFDYIDSIDTSHSW